MEVMIVLVLQVPVLISGYQALSGVEIPETWKLSDLASDFRVVELPLWSS